MKHKCPICSKTFDTLDSFDTHIENHKKDSVLNETPRTPSDDTRINNKIHPANLEKFFDEEKFQELVDEKINSIEEEHKNFYYSIIKKEDPIVSFEKGRNALKLAIEILKIIEN